MLPNTIIIVIIIICNRSQYLGACHSYLRSSIDVDSTVCFSANWTAHSVGYAHCQGTTVPAVAECHQGVCCLSLVSKRKREDLFKTKNNEQEGRKEGRRRKQMFWPPCLTVTWLANEEANVIPIYRGVAVQEVAR